MLSLHNLLTWSALIGTQEEVWLGRPAAQPAPSPPVAARHGARADRYPVRLYLQRANQWLDFDTWPPEESVPTPFYLLPHRQLGWEAPGGAGGPDTFTYDLACPPRLVGGPLLDMKESRQRDNRDIEARPGVLVYTGAPLLCHLDLVGPVSATVHVRTDTGHADLFVRLCDVDAAGVSRNVTDGILRLPPGSAGVVTAEIELHPTGYRFMRGHRLRGAGGGRGVCSVRTRSREWRAGGAARADSAHAVRDLPVWVVAHAAGARRSSLGGTSRHRWEYRLYEVVDDGDAAGGHRVFG
ncbi:CocE/NonD family hydrolase [Nonomuraea jabiensis]|uniref:CocE/NonD family hydrolase n=1 Tax=Nonomuraea jabiensis TaxID=882448 RepID=UPI0036CDAA34